MNKQRFSKKWHLTEKWWKIAKKNQEHELFHVLGSWMAKLSSEGCLKKKKKNTGQCKHKNESSKWRLWDEAGGHGGTGYSEHTFMVCELMQQAAFATPHITDDNVLENILMCHVWGEYESGAPLLTPPRDFGQFFKGVLLKEDSKEPQNARPNYSTALNARTQHRREPGVIKKSKNPAEIQGWRMVVGDEKVSQKRNPRQGIANKLTSLPSQCPGVLNAVSSPHPQNKFEKPPKCVQVSGDVPNTFLIERGLGKFPL